MHNVLGSWVTLPCHIHLGGALKNDNNWTYALITKQSEWSYKDIRDNIIQAHIKIAYDQTHDHTSISKKT